MLSYFLFDGDCGICTWSAEILKNIDAQKIFQILPYQNFSEAQLAKFGITSGECEQKVQVISEQGKIYRGAIGVNYFFWHFSPWRYLIFLIYAIPIFLLVEILVYRVVAKNRHHLSRWFGFKACLLRH